VSPDPRTAPAEEGAALVGALLAGRYRILRKLGEGAMGSVYLGEHRRIGRLDAIKVLLPSLSGDADAMARFERGAQNVSRVHHPNVCTVYDFGDADDGRRFLLMEYVPGETLQALLKREGTLPPARAVGIAVQVAGALQAAHDAGIVHRDLKPANVMVSAARGAGDAVKVVDFDIAKGSAEGEAPDVTRHGFVIGTPEYMSPEQLLGMPLDGRSDVYALALVLFEMLAGTFPGRAGDTQQRVLRRLAGAPLRLDDVLPAHGFPPALQRALDQALQARVEDRFLSAAGFAQAIREAVDVRPAPAGTPRPSTAPLPAPSVSGPASPPVPVPAPAPRDRGDTRERVPPTVVSAERDEPGATRNAAAPARARARRIAGGLLIAVLAFAAAWAVGRAVGLPPLPPLPEPRTAAVDPDPAAARPAAPSGEKGMNAVPLPDSAVPAPSATDRAEGRTQPDHGAVTRVRSGETAPPAETVPPAARAETPGPAAGDADAGDGVAAALDALEDRVGPPYPSAAELRRVRDGARAVWDQGDALGSFQRARAAFVLAHAELGLGDAGGCVRWAERAAALRAGGARQVLLDECRRVAG
jgi:serine/threonine protein kinase